MENENITAAEGKPSGYKVTKKDLRNANWRWLMSVCTFNYQTQQGASVAYALSPILRKIYTNDEDYKQALTTTSATTTPSLGSPPSSSAPAWPWRSVTASRRRTPSKT